MNLSMYEAKAAVKELLDSYELSYSYEEEGNFFSMGISLSKSRLGHIQLVIQLCPDNDDAIMCKGIKSFGLIAMKPDEEYLQNVMEYLHRVNWGMNVGNFEIDLRDYEIRYRVYINISDGLPGKDALNDLVTIPVHTCNKYGDGLLAVSMGFATAEEAIKKAEK